MTGVCPGCGDRSLDGKVTCGRVECGPSTGRKPAEWALSCRVVDPFDTAPPLERERDDIDRLFERYVAGDRVRAIRTIVNVTSGVEVPQGTIGTVEHPNWMGTSGALLVTWQLLGMPSTVTASSNVDPFERPGVKK